MFADWKKYKNKEGQVVKVLSDIIIGGVDFVLVKNTTNDRYPIKKTEFLDNFEETEESFLFTGHVEGITFIKTGGGILIEFLSRNGSKRTITIKQSERGQRRVVTAANRLSTCKLVGARHWSPAMQEQMQELVATERPDRDDQGFIDQFDIWMDREEAFYVALLADQLNKHREKNPQGRKLYSEDIH